MEFRNFIEALDREGCLERVTHRVHWRHELGRIARRMPMRPRLFEQAVEYPGARVFAGALGSASLIALALGSIHLSSVRR